MNFTKELLGNSVGGQWTRFAVSMTSALKIIRQPKFLQKKLSLIIARRKKTESAKSCNNRIVGVRGFLKYANSRGFVNIPLPSTIPRVNVTSFEPHPFTPEELARFFNEADNLEPPINCRDMRAALMKVEVPVFFRLLYSTGMRTTEARLLRVEDVDLQSGVINIRYTKSIDEHRVALHESMWSLLQMYNVKMENLMPGRKTFFPNEYDKPYSGEWVTASFKKVWKKVSTAHARAYDFRSHYAVVNINGWDHCGIEWMDKLLYLSRSMGHRYIQNTLYYYRLVPLFAHQLENLTGCGYEELLPDLNDYFEYED
ncbi:tyrosine-type recombinase/integrase [Bacteroides fragilis]